MLELFRSAHQSILGIDISSSNIKLVEISGKDENKTIEKYGSISIPSTAVDGHFIKDTDAVAHCLKLLLTKIKSTSKKAIVSVPDAAVISRVLQANNGLTDAEIEEIILMEADKYIPYPIEEISFDFEVLGPSIKNPSMLDVLIVASRSENVNSRLEVLSKAGLQGMVVDVESYAVERVVKVLNKELPINAQDKIIAVIDIDVVFANLFVLHQMKSIFTREEEFGGRQLITDLMQQYNISLQDAAQMNENQDFPEDYHEKVLQPYIDTIIVHIKRGLQFFFSTSKYSYVDHILLAGSIAKIPNIAQIVQEKVNINTTIVNPFNYLNLSDKVSAEIQKDASTFLTACGLALRKVN